MRRLLASVLLVFGLAVSDPIRDYSFVQFYRDFNVEKNRTELWIEQGENWVSVLDQTKVRAIPQNPESYKACDIFIKTSSLQDGKAWSATANDGTLRAPVLFLEGIDFFDEANAGLTAYDMYEFLKGMGLSDPLRLRGNDVVTLNYEHSSEDIFLNGEYVAQVLYWINTHLEGGVSPVTVVGTSMGGLVGRIAIKKYETAWRSGSQKPIGLYISLDAPHQGANIPNSLFRLLEGLNYMSKPSEKISKGIALYNLLTNSVAANQMLIKTGSQYQVFQSAYSNYKSLPGTRQIAITNGSISGVEQEYLPWDGFSKQPIASRFTANPALLYKPLSTALAGGLALDVDLEGDKDIPLVPTFMAFHYILQAGIDQANPWWRTDLYEKIQLISIKPLLFRVREYRMSNGWNSSIPLDVAPGGYFPFYSMLLSEIDKKLSRELKDDEQLKLTKNRQVLNAGHTCFIPTVSGIDYRKSDGSAAINDKDLVFANLKQIDPDVTANTTFDEVYGVKEDGFSSSPVGRSLGFWRNQLHISGSSEDNAYRILCEIAFADNGKIPAKGECDDSETDRGLARKIWSTVDLRGDNGMPNWNNVVETTDRYLYPLNTVDAFVRKHQVATVYEGTPVQGWQEVYKLPYLLKAGDEISVDIYVPGGRYSYLSLTGTLTGADDGCGWQQLATNILNTAGGGWQSFKWVVPSYYKPQCRQSDGATMDDFASFKLFLNAPNVSDPLMITGLRVVRAGNVVKVVPKLPVAKSQVIPFASGTSFLLGDWGTHDRDYGNLGQLKVSVDQPWQGAVLFNNGGLDISGYTYLEVEAKSNAPYGMSKMMIFLDDHPDLESIASSGWKNPYRVNPYGKRYNFWESMEYLGSAGDGYETRRVPLSWLTSTKTTSKILIQHASWVGIPSEEFVIRSMRFVK